MKFELTEEQKILQDTVRDFAQKELAPVVEKADLDEEFPWDSFKGMAELGLTGMILPEEYGGSETGELELNIAMEEIARVSPSCAHILDSHLMLCGSPILHYGTEAQKQKYLPDIASGEKLGAFALTEPNAGSDVMGLQTKAEKTDSGYTMNGSKTFISNGEMCKTAVIIGNIPSMAPKGSAAFIIEDGMEGFTKGEKFKKLGMKSATTSELFFEDLELGPEQLLGEEGQGLRIALSTLDRGRIGIAAQAIGIAQGVLDLCVKYSNERIQFGGPISKQQAVAFKMADMATEIEAGRMLYQKAAYLADSGKPFGPNAAMAKVFCSELAMKAATMGIQIFGGYGYMMEYPVQRYFRDAKLTEIYEGTSEVQRIIISRSVLK
jgi:alkylation response protein AidB-like acyl-CoA dehydrogenase